MSELSDSDIVHLEGWAARGYGYAIYAQVQCLWCDYITVGDTPTAAVRQYYHEHEDVIRAKADEARRDYLGS